MDQVTCTLQSNTGFAGWLISKETRKEHVQVRISVGWPSATSGATFPDVKHRRYYPGHELSKSIKRGSRSLSQDQSTPRLSQATSRNYTAHLPPPTANQTPIIYFRLIQGKQTHLITRLLISFMLVIFSIRRHLMRHNRRTQVHVCTCFII